MKSKAMNARLLFSAAAVLLVGALFACAAPPASAPQIVPQTVIVQATQIVPQTVVVEATAAAPAATTPEATAAPAAASGQPLDKVRISINSKLTAPDTHKALGLAAFMGLYFGSAAVVPSQPGFLCVAVSG